MPPRIESVDARSGRLRCAGYMIHVDFADIDAPTAVISIICDGDRDPAPALRTLDDAFRVHGPYS